MKRRKASGGKRGARRTSNARKPATSPGPPDEGPRIGLEATIERIVEHQYTIQALDPNLPPVLSTPAMIGLMEHASVVAVRPHLPAGVITVGTRVEVDHLKAVPPGATVQAYARFVKYKGRFLVFDVEARSGDQVIGRGRVFRAMVDPHKHEEKAQARMQQ
jgi:fluoroacetyl-CoA thioesterase